jgi:4a-hydroxytetrahydrobiopterin dehydratase
MPKVKALSATEIEQQLAAVSGWSVVNGKLHREFKFADFVRAFGFMSQVAILAQAAGHHPEWFNVYNRLIIDLVTHDAGDTISQRDLDLAKQINALFT